MADVKWIKIVTDIFDDEKILLIEQMPEPDTIIVVWFKLLCLAGKQNNSGVFMINERIPYTEEMLASVFRRPLNTVRMALKTFSEFGMVEIINGAITIPNWGKHQTLDKIEQKTAYMREYMQDYRQKQICKANSKGNSKANSKANVSSAEEDKEEEKEKDNVKETNKEINNSNINTSIKKESPRAGGFNAIISSYSSNENLKLAIIEFIKMRKLIKKPMTDRALSLTLKDLDRLSKTDSEKIAILEKSISRCWQGVFPLKENEDKPAESTDINKAIDIINNRRNQAELLQSRFLADLRKNPSFAEAESRLDGLRFDKSKAECQGRDTTDLERKMKEAEAEFAAVLGKIGYSLSDLETKYTCQKCKDTGFINGAKCECLKKIMED